MFSVEKGKSLRQIGILRLLSLFCLVAILVLTAFRILGLSSALSSTSEVVLLLLAASALAAWLVERRPRTAKQAGGTLSAKEPQDDLRLDSVSGLLLRRFFLEACTARIAEAQAQTRFVYMAVDLDYLKMLNDTLGHAAGDEALRRTGAVLRANLPEDAVMGRIGGDEFAALFICDGREDAESTAARVLEQMRVATPIMGRDISLSASLGLTLLPDHTRDLSEALRFSDLALYEGKKSGRDRATWFSFTLHTRFQQERHIERELRRDLTARDLRLLYLPVVNSAGIVHSARAQPDWHSRWLGSVAPETILSITHASDLVHLIGETVVDMVCEDLARIPHIPLSAELYPNQLRRDEVVSMIEAAIGRHRIDPARLIVTVGIEAASAAIEPEVKRRLCEIRALGVRIALDNFGPMVCDPARFRDFPVDFVRVPATQIAHLGESEIDNAVVGALVSVAGAMGLSVTADGVTNSEQWLLAHTAGCVRFSGPLISDPISVEALGERLQGGRMRLMQAAASA